MNTQNNELRTIATLMSKNLTSTILLLHSIGYDFNNSVEDQDNQVDEKLSQMFLAHLTSDASESVIEVPQQVKEEHQQEVIQQEVQTTESPVDDKVLRGFEFFESDFENEKIKKINFLKNEIEKQKINIKKYRQGEALTKRVWLCNQIVFFSKMRFFGVKKYVKKYIENNSIYSQRLNNFELNNYKEEVTQLVNEYFESAISDKENKLNEIIKKYDEIFSANFEIV